MTELTREQKLDILQKEFSRKDLDMGCEVYSKAYHKKMTIAYVFTAGGRKHGRILGESNKDTLYIEYLGYSGDVSEKDISKVYGHPVFPQDILQWAKDKEFYISFCTSFGKCSTLFCSVDTKDEFQRVKEEKFWIHWDYSCPLSEQSDEVINGLYEVVLLSKK